MLYVILSLIFVSAVWLGTVAIILSAFLVVIVKKFFLLETLEWEALLPPGWWFLLGAVVMPSLTGLKGSVPAP